METLKLVVLGIVQGLTEFLPVSSSGHLVLLGNIFGISNSLFVSIILHSATLLSILIVLRKEVFYLVKRPFSDEMYRLVVATIPTCLIALVLMPLVSDAFGGAFLGGLFLVTALILASTKFVKSPGKDLSYKHAVIMGIAQGLAVFPGLSRSGLTIGAGLWSGAKKEQVAKFSFLMSIPIIILSLILEIIKLCVFKETISVNVFGLVLAFITAFLVGIVAIKSMLKITQKSFKLFSIYLIIIAILTLF